MTPMMLQYFEIKNKHTDSILFYRLGDFYEMFFEDALLVSKLLELTLTGRECGEPEKAPMCGVPYHAANGYIARLIALGYKVAICEQTSEPEKGKGLVSREVVRIITPGTVVDPLMLDEKTSNYILCVVFVNKKVSLAYADVSTGEFIAHVLNSAEKELKDEIIRISPHEILTNDTSRLQQALNETLPSYTLPESWVRMATAKKTMLTHFNAQNATALGLEEKDLRIVAVGGLLSYLQETQKNKLAHLTTVRCYQGTQVMRLDRATRKNLELTESLRYQERRGSLLWLLDKTQTAMGSRLLRSWIENPLIDKKAIEERLDAVESLFNDLALSKELEQALSPVCDLERLISKISYGNLNARDCLALLRSLRAIAPILHFLKDTTCLALSLLARTLTPLPSLCEWIESAIDENCPLALNEGGMIKAGYNHTLDAYREATTNGKQWLLDMETNERVATGIKNLKIQQNRIFGFYIEVTKSYLHLVPAHYIRKQTLANCERYITPDLQDIEKKINEAQQSSFALELSLFNDLREGISKEIGVILQNALSLKTLDVLLSFAQVARDNNYIKPIFNDTGVIEITEGRHPIVEKMLQDNSFVPNDCTLNLYEDRMHIITGPNMSGKSTYMRQVALLSLMAQLGSFVPAQYANMSVCDRIFTRIGASDDLASGQSTFMVEMSETAGILQNATENSLIILDEIGRGTSTFDGLAIAWACVEHLVSHHKKGPKTLFATHYHELSELEGHLSGIKNYCVSVTQQGENVIFLRKIIPGGSDKSYGIYVARLAGIPSKIVARANEIQARLEVSGINQENISSNILEQKKKQDKQLNLFSMEQDALIEEIQNLEVLSITPMEALNTLFRLREKARKL